ncbi:MAG: transposase [Sphingobacteriales bacterium]|nr:MAG: transposase [Sphingobacteriales bacterium]
MDTKKTNQENSGLEVSAINRTFSEALKRKLIEELDKKVITIGQIITLYGVSRTSIYKWRYLYSVHYEKQTKVVIQMESEASKNIFLNQRVAELERVVGQKQLEIDYLNKVIDFANKDYSIDLKKKCEHQSLNGSASTPKHTTTK